MGRYTPEQAHRIMSAVKSKNTKPELILRRALWKRNYRYRIHVKELVGKPDIVFSRAKLAIFCDGDFWHGHNWAIRGIASFEEELAGYSPFWREKILRNVQRDIEVNKALQEEGWFVLRIWESDILSYPEKCVEMIESAYNNALNDQKPCSITSLS